MNILTASPAMSQDFVETAVQLLVTRFIPLNSSDLEAWMADPEEWVNLEEKDSELWEFELRVRSICEAQCYLIFSFSLQFSLAVNVSL